jgi:fatty acid desaturase
MSPSTIIDDLSADFNAVSGRIVHPSGVRYHIFRKSLKPVYWKVWFDIALGYVAIAAICIALAEIPYPGWVTAVLAAVVASAPLGYLHHYLGLFMHEAAHHNIAPSRRANDLLANIFLGVPQGYSVQSYRPAHFGHHREIGSPEDPERHYFHALDWELVILTFSGVRTAREIRQRLSQAAKSGPAPTASSAKPGINWVMIGGALLHGSIVVGSVATGHWPLGLAWTLGFLIWFPFFITLRQILEHRDFDAAKETDFTQVPHGAISRVFGDGPVARTLGAAGFSRHLLHHWEPQVSCTRLRDLEAFLLETEVGPIIRARRETYLSALGKLIK